MRLISLFCVYVLFVANSLKRSVTALKSQLQRELDNAIVARRDAGNRA